MASTIAGEWQQANDMQSSAIRQLEAMIRAALLLTKTQVQIASAAKGHWDYSGIAEKVLTTPSGQINGDGQYDSEYLRAVQAMWASYTIWLATPIKVVVNGQEMDLGRRPLDLILSTPVAAKSVVEQI
jgi:hypothetical protein